MTIEVTLSDIKACRSKRFKGGFYHCPIELAAQRAMKKSVLSIGCTNLFTPDDKKMYDLPPEAQSFAEAYEGGVKVEPITFEITDGR